MMVSDKERESSSYRHQVLKTIEKESKDIKFNFNEQPLGGVGQFILQLQKRAGH